MKETHLFFRYRKRRRVDLLEVHCSLGSRSPMAGHPKKSWRYEFLDRGWAQKKFTTATKRSTVASVLTFAYLTVNNAYKKYVRYTRFECNTRARYQILEWRVIELPCKNRRPFTIHFYEGLTPPVCYFFGHKMQNWVYGNVFSTVSHIKSRQLPFLLCLRDVIAQKNNTDTTKLTN